MGIDTYGERKPVCRAEKDNRGSCRPAGSGQQLAEIAVSGDDHQGVGSGIIEDAPIGCREEPYVADVNGLQSGLAQSGGNLPATGWRR